MCGGPSGPLRFFGSGPPDREKRTFVTATNTPANTRSIPHTTTAQYLTTAQHYKNDIPYSPPQHSHTTNTTTILTNNIPTQPYYITPAEHTELQKPQTTTQDHNATPNYQTSTHQNHYITRAYHETKGKSKKRSPFGGSILEIGCL